MKETITLRIQDLMTKGKELEQQIMQVNGALQQCQWTLEQLEQQDATKEIDKPKSV
jgi:hypothetical protein